MLRDEISELVLKPDKAKLREVIQNTLGEFDNIDYKQSWESFSKLSKHILALANSGGGLIVIGIAQDKTTGIIEPKGLDKFLDKADVFKKSQAYLPPYVEYKIHDYEYKESEYESLKGKKIQVVHVSDNINYLPFISVKDGDGIFQNRIYVRKGTQSIEASYEDLQKIINRRINTEYSNASVLSLEEHLKQLKILFEQIGKNISTFSFFPEEALKEWKAFHKKNPKYPKEEFSDFVVTLIEMKKEIIRKLIRGV